jgi:hypothetical protein
MVSSQVARICDVQNRVVKAGWGSEVGVGFT